MFFFPWLLTGFPLILYLLILHCLMLHYSLLHNLKVHGFNVIPFCISLLVLHYFHALVYDIALFEFTLIITALFNVVLC